jgi:hypothetical protein
MMFFDMEILERLRKMMEICHSRRDFDIESKSRRGKRELIHLLSDAERVKTLNCDGNLP